MNEKLEMAQHNIIERIGKMSENFGLNKAVVQLYTILYLSDKPLSLDDMMERLKISKGSVSLNIRELEEWGAVRNVWVKGSRKDYYMAELDIKKVFANKLRSSVQKRVSQVSDMIDEFNEIVKSAESELTEEEKAIVKVYRERLKKIEGMKSLASKALSLVGKIM